MKNSHPSCPAVAGKVKPREPLLQTGCAVRRLVPNRASLVEGIQDDIAARRVIETLHELAGRVVGRWRHHLCFEPDGAPGTSAPTCPQPVSPMNLHVLRLRHAMGMRSMGVMSLVLKPTPSPFTVLLNCFGVSISGPFRRRPYFNSFLALDVLECGDWQQAQGTGLRLPPR